MEWTDKSLLSLLRIDEDDDRFRRADITAEASVGVAKRRPGVTGIVSS